jgi:two-component system LytT family response regulator
MNRRSGAFEWDERMRVLIVDDEPVGRERLRALLEAEPDVEIVGECDNGRDAVEAIASLAPDLVFLDVQMPGMDGIAVVRALGPRRFPLIVFVTGFDRYAVEAFDFHACDYLLKPFTQERFRKTLARANAELRDRDIERLDERLASLLERFSPGNGYLRRLVVRLDGRIRFFGVEEIDWVEAHAKFVRLHAGGVVYPLRESIGHLEEKLDPSRFLRVHRSAIVNIERVAEVEASGEGTQTVVLKDGTRLPLSRGNRLRLYEVAAVEDPALPSR